MKRILIVTPRKLFSEGLTGLLSQEKYLLLEVNGIGDRKQFWEAVKSFNPDIILWDEIIEPDIKIHLLDELANYNVSQILMFNMDNNRINQYSREQFEVTSLKGFLDRLGGSAGQAQEASDAGRGRRRRPKAIDRFPIQPNWSFSGRLHHKGDKLK